MPAKKSAKKSAGNTPVRTPANRGSFEDLILKYPPTVQATAARLRAIVYEVLPKAEEKVYPTGWTVAIYKDGEDICAISPKKARCNFFLWQGAHLPDPDGLLEGTGKNARHVKISSPDDIPTTGIKKLIRAGKKLAKNNDGSAQ
jgi:hypothetical protein